MTDEQIKQMAGEIAQQSWRQRLFTSKPVQAWLEDEGVMDESPSADSFATGEMYSQRGING